MSISLAQLWLPIVLGTVLAWIASMLIHILLKYHNSDYQRLSNEDEVMAAVAKGSPNLGVHTYPYCVDWEAMKDPAVQKKFEDGPVGMLTVFPNGMPNMGKLVPLQIAFFLVGCLLIAYCATLALEPGADYLVVFRFVATTGFLAFGWGRRALQHLVRASVVDDGKVPAGCVDIRPVRCRRFRVALARSLTID